MNADGSFQTRVTIDNAFNFDLSWSRDGNRLVFCSTLNGGFEIYIMDLIEITTATFTDPIKITNNTVMNFHPTWSPGGLNIAFDAQLNGIPGIFIINLGSSNITPLNTSPDSGSQPSWSPDGNRIAFASMQGIHTVTVSGTDLQQLTSSYALVPEYSPNGDQIAYVTNYAGEDIFIINADGTENHRITTSADNDFVPSWSPDGNRLVYEGSISGIDQICVIDTDGTNYQQLTNIGVNTGPSWYPVLGPSSVNNDTDNLLLNDFRLFQNYPNPFNPETKITYSIPRRGFVSLKVFDVLGNYVQSLVNENQSAGLQSISWDGRDKSGKDISFGVYMYRIKVGVYYRSKKMISIK